jgi:hypothetical protein
MDDKPKNAAAQTSNVTILGVIHPSPLFVSDTLETMYDGKGSHPNSNAGQP